MSDLQAAMDRVDAIGGAGEAFTPVRPPLRLATPPEAHQEPAPPHPDPIEAAAVAEPQPAPEAAPAATAAPPARDALEGVDISEASREFKINLLDSFARTYVAIAAELGGQNPRYVRQCDTMLADAVRDIGVKVMDAKAIVMPAAFRQLSLEADIIVAQAVAKAIAGGAQGTS